MWRGRRGVRVGEGAGRRWGSGEIVNEKREEGG